MGVSYLHIGIGQCWGKILGVNIVRKMVRRMGNNMKVEKGDI